MKGPTAGCISGKRLDHVDRAKKRRTGQRTSASPPSSTVERYPYRRVDGVQLAANGVGLRHRALDQAHQDCPAALLPAVDQVLHRRRRAATTIRPCADAQTATAFADPAHAGEPPGRGYRRRAGGGIDRRACPASAAVTPRVLGATDQAGEPPPGPRRGARRAVAGRELAVRSEDAVGESARDDQQAGVGVRQHVRPCPVRAARTKNRLPVRSMIPIVVPHTLDRRALPPPSPTGRPHVLAVATADVPVAQCATLISLLGTDSRPQAPGRAGPAPRRTCAQHRRAASSSRSAAVVDEGARPGFCTPRAAEAVPAQSMRSRM